MPNQIQAEPTLLRVVPVPVSPDADWRATNDLVGWKAANPLWITPTRGNTGILQVTMEFLDPADEIVVPAANSRVTFDIVEKVRLNAGDAHSSEVLLNDALGVEIRGDLWIDSGLTLRFNQHVAFRMTGSASLPGGANRVMLIGRFA